MATLVLVTGATDGIGRETALELARRGATVLAHGRSGAKAREVHAALRATSGAPHPEPVLADFASLASVRAMASELGQRGLACDVLLHNAGAVFPARRDGEDGHELTLTVNHLAPFLLTHAVLAGPASARLRRVVFVSSMAQRNGVLRLDDVDRRRVPYDPYLAYAATKLANVLTAVALAGRLAPRGATANALHPGVVSTKLITEGFGARGGDTLAEGAATSVWAALSPDVEGLSGRYFDDCREVAPHPVTRDPDFVERFYALSLALTGAPPVDPPKPTGA